MISRNDIAEGFKTANKALKPKDRKRTMYIWKAKKPDSKSKQSS